MARAARSCRIMVLMSDPPPPGRMGGEVPGRVVPAPGVPAAGAGANILLSTGVRSPVSSSTSIRGAIDEGKGAVPFTGGGEDPPMASLIKFRMFATRIGLIGPGAGAGAPGAPGAVGTVGERIPRSKREPLVVLGPRIPKLMRDCPTLGGRFAGRGALPKPPPPPRSDPMRPPRPGVWGRTPMLLRAFRRAMMAEVFGFWFSGMPIGVGLAGFATGKQVNIGRGRG